MTTFILNFTEKIFDKIHRIWESPKANKVISLLLVGIFILVSILSVLANFEERFFSGLSPRFKSPFFAIEVTFTILLVFELFSLIFVLPSSVSRSVAKQLELLSLIFIRATFKEFSHIQNFKWEQIPPQVINMGVYVIGSMLIFVLLGFISKLRTYEPISNDEDKNRKFVQARKLVAVLLIIASFVLGIHDLDLFFKGEITTASFHLFYTFLIFSDILVVLIALRYTLSYYKIFRYSAFVVATIFIRMALSAPMYHNVIIGTLVTLFVLVLTISYKYYSITLREKTN